MRYLFRIVRGHDLADVRRMPNARLGIGWHNLLHATGRRLAFYRRSGAQR